MDDKQDSKDQGVEYSTQGSSQATIEPLPFMSIVDLTENGEQSQGDENSQDDGGSQGDGGASQEPLPPPSWSERGKEPTETRDE